MIWTRVVTSQNQDGIILVVHVCLIVVRKLSTRRLRPSKVVCIELVGLN